MWLITFFYIILNIIFPDSNQILNESIEFIHKGNYISNNKYIDNTNHESYYYNNIYTLINTDESKNNYLKGLIEIDGEISKSFFENFYTKYPDDVYADNAAVKIADFYYSSGLYIQSSEWYKKIPTEYPNSKHLNKSITYFLNSLLIAGYTDTATYYVKKFSKEYPHIKFSNEFIIQSEIKESKNISNKKNVHNIHHRFSVQVGSYKNYQSAKLKKELLDNEGFMSRIDEILDNGNVLYSVRIGIFNNQSLAKKEQSRLISRIGLYDSIIVEIH